MPLTPRALAALDSMPARLGLLFPAPAGGLLNRDLHSTFASDSLAVGRDGV